MKSETLNNFLPTMSKFIDDYLNNIKVDVIEYNTFNQLNWDIAWIFIVGQRGYKYKSTAKDHYIKVTGAIGALPINLPGTKIRKALDSKDALLKILSEIFETDSNQDLLVDSCLKAVQESAQLTHGDIRRTLFGLLFASYETTASNLNSLIWHLINHPEVLEKLKEEIQAYPIPETVSDFHKYGYLNKVVKESLRLSSGIAITRRTNCAVQYKDLYFPKDTDLVVATGFGHQEVKDWKSFDPERTDNYKWEPFGSAPRNCLGKVFAQVQLKLILIKLLSRYHLTPQLDQDAQLDFRGMFKNASFKLSQRTTL